ncbi:MAG: xanthine dehydrogenase family protein subunit M [Candidatus Rokuibacteriota bacterium]
MKPPAFEYVAVASTEEAVAQLAAHGDDARLLAGGQSLMPILNMRLATPGRLVDLNRVRTLSYIVERAGGVAIGAMTRQRTVERSEFVAAAVPLLAEALPWVGHTAIRNRGTIGGSLAHADPAAELPAVAVCLDARLTLRGPAGERTLAAREFFRGYLTTALAPTELLAEVWFPSALPGTGAAWIEFARRYGDYALVGVAAVVTLEGSTVRRASLAVTGVDGVPVRAVDAERLLIGAPLSAESMAAAAESVRRTLEPQDDIHATAAYRRHLAGILTVRALTRAGDRARLA